MLQMMQGKGSSEEPCSGNGTIFNTVHAGLPVCMIELLGLCMSEFPSCWCEVISTSEDCIGIPVEGATATLSGPLLLRNIRHFLFPSATMADGTIAGVVAMG